MYYSIYWSINITINRHFSLLKVKVIADLIPLKLDFILSFQTFIRTALSVSRRFVLVQSLIHVRLFETTLAAADQAPLSFIISQSLLKFMSIESGTPSNHLIFCWPLFLLPLIFPSIRVFSSESTFHIRWPKNWSFSFNISPSNVYSGLISFRIV